MCRNIKTLANFDPPATDDEIYASALQFVRKLSGTTKPSKANEAVFNRGGRRGDGGGAQAGRQPGDERAAEESRGGSEESEGKESEAFRILIVACLIAFSRAGTASRSLGSGPRSWLRPRTTDPRPRFRTLVVARDDTDNALACSRLSAHRRRTG